MNPDFPQAYLSQCLIEDLLPPIIFINRIPDLICKEATSEKTIRNYIKNQNIDKTEEGNRMKQLKLFKL